MARLPEYFNIGDTDNITMEEMIVLLQRMYTDLAEAINSKPDVYQRTTDGQTTDTFLANGDININLSTNKVQMLTNHPTQSTVTWTTLS